MKVPLGLGCFKKEQYQDLLKISSDAEKMYPTWEDWLIAKEKTKRRLMSIDQICVDVEVDLFDLMDYCQREGLKINGESRAQFAQHLIMRGMYS